jgi:hypothetical protein
MAKTKGDKTDPNAKFKRKRGGGTEKKQRSNHSLNPGLSVEIFWKNININELRKENRRQEQPWDDNAYKIHHKPIEDV